MNESQADGWTWFDVPDPDPDCMHPRIRTLLTERGERTVCFDCGTPISRVYPGPDEWVSA